MSGEANLIERLRDRGHVEVRRLLGSDRYDMIPRGTADEAAAEIERLRAALREIAESGEADEAAAWMVDLAEETLRNGR